MHGQPQEVRRTDGGAINGEWRECAGVRHALAAESLIGGVGGHRQVIWEWLWRSRCEWIGWRKVMADCVFQTAAAVMIWFQTAKRLVISVRHSGALIR